MKKKNVGHMFNSKMNPFNISNQNTTQNTLAATLVNKYDYWKTEWSRMDGGTRRTCGGCPMFEVQFYPYWSRSGQILHQARISANIQPLLEGHGRRESSYSGFLSLCLGPPLHGEHSTGLVTLLL